MVLFPKRKLAKLQLKDRRDAKDAEYAELMERKRQEKWDRQNAGDYRGGLRRMIADRKAPVMNDYGKEHS